MKIVTMDETYHFTFVAGSVKMEDINMPARSLSDEATRGQRNSHELTPVTAGSWITPVQSLNDRIGAKGSVQKLGL